MNKTEKNKNVVEELLGQSQRWMKEKRSKSIQV